MAPETFVQIVENQQAALISGPGEPLAVGATEHGAQVAVLEGKGENDAMPNFVVITAPTTDLEDNRFATEVIWVGSRQVRHPSRSGSSRERTLITLADRRVVSLPGKREAQADHEHTARIGSLAIHPVTTGFDYSENCPRTGYNSSDEYLPGSV